MDKLTMVDIARISGVSLTTVGRVVRKNGYVSREKRELVEEVIRETGYIPNRVAQGLKSKKTSLIGHLTIFNPNMLYERISKAVNSAAGEVGYQVLTYTVELNDGNWENILDELIARRVDGIIITSHPSLEERVLEKVAGHNIPLVLVERTREGESLDRIVIADYQGAFNAVDHILSRGHKRIAYVGREADHPVEQRRLQGYRDALAAAGRETDPSLISLWDTYGVEEGRKAAEELLNREDPPSAVFMSSDLFVCGFLQICYEKRILVPDEISLVGYDDTLSMMLSPPITSVGLDLSHLGREAVSLLLARRDDWERESREIINETYLADRGSVKIWEE